MGDRDEDIAAAAEERAWYARGVETYLDASYRAGSRAMPSEFAGQFGTDPASLCRTFQRLFNKTPLEYFRSQQLLYAAKLLRRSRLTVAQISATTGLGTRSNFFRIFAERFGMTPEQYRQMR